jgi:uncharacterized membrane protein
MSEFKINTSKKMTISAMVMALYVVVMYCTSSFAFGAVQVRIATALYSLSYFFPFLVLPLGLANLVSNILGGMGIVDMLGGCGVGILTSFCVYMVRRLKLPFFLVAVPIVLGPGMIVPIWLTAFTGVPYGVLVVNLCLGQVAPALLGAAAVRVLETRRDIAIGG